MNTRQTTRPSDQVYVDIIYEDLGRGIRIERRSSYDDTLVALFDNTLWGSGGFLYKMLDVAGALNRLEQPHLLYLIDDEQLVAAAVRVRKTLCVANKKLDAFHLAALAVHPKKIGKGYGKLLTEQSRRYYLKEVHQPGILYGYIEAGNIRSFDLNTKIGFQELGRIQGKVFSRVRPRDDARARRVERKEKRLLANLLDDQYKDHLRQDFGSVLENTDYYVWHGSDGIVAGVQVAPAHVQIRRLPGVGGSFILNIGRLFPSSYRSFSLASYRFLRFGNLYVQNGQERQALRLMEALLARRHVRAGVLFLDTRSPICQRITSVGHFGLVDKVVSVSLDAIADFAGLLADEANAIRQRPLCTSPDDVLVL